MKPIRIFDTQAAGLIAKIPSGFQKPFELTGLLASPPGWGFLVALVAIISSPNNSAPFIATLVLLPLATLIKFGFRRSRPPTIYAGNMRIKSYSFPSSHSYAAALSCTLFAYLIGLSFTPIFALVALFVAVSRVYVGAHYPSDVIAGLLFGLIVGIGVITWFY